LYDPDAGGFKVRTLIPDREGDLAGGLAPRLIIANRKLHCRIVIGPVSMPFIGCAVSD
jgi:hypothetical protein